jgi:hypothetical protein
MAEPATLGIGANSSMHRGSPGPGQVEAVGERRKFVDNHDELPYEAKELVQAVGAHILMRRRRFMTQGELQTLVGLLGYPRIPTAITAPRSEY